MSGSRAMPGLVNTDRIGALAAWFEANRRDLPWRSVDAAGNRSPYAALVSELMLQQTQVSRMLEKYGPFMERFPDVASLAAAPEADVLAEWSGLGYYRRARMLHGAARAVVRDHAGLIPRDVATLRQLPGVGRYTAGAIASIAFGEAAPIVDGNVARVLFRLHGKDVAGDDKGALRWAWEQAEQLAREAHDLGVVAEFNEALMELGATVCVPRGPKCGQCPLAGACQARRLGRQDEIPRPKTASKRTALWCGSAIVRDQQGRLLVEKRTETGLWGGLWQAPTLERTDRAPTKSEVARAVGSEARHMRRVAAFKHGTTHRDVVFVVYEMAEAVDRVAQADRGEHRVWRTAAQIARLGISNAQSRILLGIASDAPSERKTAVGRKTAPLERGRSLS